MRKPPATLGAPGDPREPGFGRGQSDHASDEVHEAHHGHTGRNDDQRYQSGRSQNPTADRRDLLVKRCEQLAKALDSAFTVPGTSVRIGWDALLGLVPGLGDLIGFVLGFYIVYAGLVLRIPYRFTALMALNLVLDWAIGLIPLGGDVFDWAWKANERNVRILRRGLSQKPDHHDEGPGSWSRRTLPLWVVGLVSLTWSYFYLRPPAPVPVEPWFPRQDLAQHFAGMLIHGLSCMWAAAGRGRSLVVACALSLLFGSALECLQGILNWGRTFDGADLLANGLGVGSALLLAKASPLRRILLAG